MAGAIPVTFFQNQIAAEKTEQQIALHELQDLIRRTSAPTKERLPWLKLARFGDRRSDKGSLRHDANLTAISGIEADYDDEEVSFEQAVEVAERAGLRAIIYTSPSHSAERPRWRILCPTSRELAPSSRTQLLARINGLYRGIFAVESFTLSQSYFFGSVNGNPNHRVEIIDGRAIDELEALDQIALGKPNGAAVSGATAGPANGPVDERALAEGIIKGDSYHTSCVRLVGKWAQQGVPLLDAQKRLYDHFDQVFPPDRDARWRQRRSDVPRIIEGIYGKDAEQRDARERSEAGGGRPRKLEIVRFDEMCPRLSGRPLVKGVLETEQTSLCLARADAARRSYASISLCTSRPDDRGSGTR